jgi:two-component system, sensor histidine kinase and response regulator
MSDKPHIRRGMELGADDYIEKPFTIPELVKAVRVRFEKQAELVQRAERKLQELRTSLSLALPHELVTPLNSILGFSSLLKDSVLPPEEVQECARHINEAACRLQRLVENFCFYAHLEVSATDPQKRADLIRSEQYPVVDLLASAAQKVARNHRREQDLSLNLEEATLVVSPSYLQRLVTELVDNAFKFSQPGTLVSLHSRHVETGYHLTVEDQGKGMTAEQIDHVGAHIQFERKFQEQQGSGLGLAISRRLAEAHRGSLWIESTPGKGTKVQVILGR